MRREIKPGVAAVVILIVLAVVGAAMWFRTTPGGKGGAKNNTGEALTAIAKDPAAKEALRNRWHQLYDSQAEKDQAAQADKKSK